MSAEDRWRGAIPVNDNGSDTSACESEISESDSSMGGATRRDLMDMPDVGTLPFAAQLIVWALRSWVGAFKSKQDFATVTESAFTRFGLGRSADAIDGMMTIVAATASRSIDIRCIKCRLLSPDEAVVIDAVSAIQNGGHFAAHEGLSDFVPAAAARSAFPHLLALARDLAEAQLLLRAGGVRIGDASPQQARVGRTLH